MDTRLGWLAALAAIGLVLARLGLLLVAGTGTSPWLPILLAALTLGGAATALLMVAGSRSVLLFLASLCGAVLALARVAAGPTLFLGVLPTAASSEILRDQMTLALELIRYGAAPVLAMPGLVAFLAALFWLLGATMVYGGVRRWPLLMVGPPLAFYLVLATLDRSPVRWWFAATLALVGGLGMLSGRVRTAGGRVRNATTGQAIPASARSLPVIVVVGLVAAAVGTSAAFAATVPESGLIAWRSASGFGAGLFGGFSVNVFAGMQQDLVTNDSTVVFAARVSEAAPPNRDLYWKLTTLDVFDGETWQPGRLAVKPPDQPTWESGDFAFAGPTVRVEQVVRIMALRQNYLPLVYSPVALRTDDAFLKASHRIREDGSITFDINTREGMIYRVTSDIPQPDLSVLASVGGELSPIFAAAAAAGEIAVTASPVQNPLPPARVRKDYTGLPDDLPEQVGLLAEVVTKGGSTSYERALLLEAFFRTTGGFIYDATATSGHSSLDLTSWLTDPDSRNYRTGYCEQFATAMAVMARTLSIPSRVVIGFAPGEVTRTEDGEEQIVVRARNAHAWVELYMGGQGWIRFDPTPRGDGINPATVDELGFDPIANVPEPGEPGGAPAQAIPPLRPGEDLLESGADPTLGLPSSPGFRLPPWLATPLMLTALLGALPAGKSLRSLIRRRQVRGGDLTAAWRELTDRLVDLGYPIHPSQTPREVALAIDRALLPLAAAVSGFLYGGKGREDRMELLSAAERNLRDNHQGWRWWQSQLRLRSLLTRRQWLNGRRRGAHP